LAVCLAIGLSSVPAAEALTPGQLRAHVYKTDPCLAHIVDHENGLWLPTRYGAGHSYGLPQAQPAEKMASAGADWRTNPWTQLRWMRGYVNGRYGSSCAAWAFWQRNRWY
jgi:hypothetical protein